MCFKVDFQTKRVMNLCKKNMITWPVVFTKGIVSRLESNTLTQSSDTLFNALAERFCLKWLYIGIALSQNVRLLPVKGAQNTLHVLSLDFTRRIKIHFKSLLCTNTAQFYSCLHHAARSRAEQATLGHGFLEDSCLFLLET